MGEEGMEEVVRAQGSHSLISTAMLYPSRSQIALFVEGGGAICDRGHYKMTHLPDASFFY
jgi:hypothetical protein